MVILNKEAMVAFENKIYTQSFVHILFVQQALS